MATPIKLLPNYFKKVGLFLIIISIISAVIIKVFHLDDLFNKKILGTIFIDLLIIFCSLIIFSRDKIEDEMTFFIRLKHFAGTFAGMVTMVILRNIMDIASGDNPKNYSATELILFMCLMHLTFHYVNLWNNRKSNKE